MNIRLPRLGVLLIGLMTTSCMTPMPATRIKTQWKDPQWNSARFHRALIIGVFPLQERRQLFEDQVAKRLEKYVDKADPSYKFLPDISAADRPKIEALVHEQQIDAVFITRLIGKTTIQTEVPGYTQEVPASPLDGATSYLNAGNQEIHTPGYQMQQSVAILETKVFDSRTGTVVWTCRSDTLIDGYLDKSWSISRKR